LYKLRGEIQVEIQRDVCKNNKYTILTKPFLYNFEIYYLTKQRCYTLLFTDFIYCYFEVLLQIKIPHIIIKIKDSIYPQRDHDFVDITKK
jgi:hypothetical protein